MPQNVSLHTVPGPAFPPPGYRDAKPRCRSPPATHQGAGRAAPARAARPRAVDRARSPRRDARRRGVPYQREPRTAGGAAPGGGRACPVGRLTRRSRSRRRSCGSAWRASA
ncbi:MAG: hypothetical protein F4Z07_00050 [Dehalococcoidia bacterium]|nr:hypothetical protein [Dehalococcoidia bacterium]